MRNLAFVTCVLLVLCSAVAVAQQQQPTTPAPAAKTINWGAIGTIASIALSVFILIYGFGMKFSSLSTKVDELMWFHHLTIETMWKDYLGRLKESLLNPEELIVTAKTKEDLLSQLQKERKSVKKILDGVGSPQQKVIEIAREIGLERLKTLVDAKDTTTAIGKLAVLIEDYSSQRTTKKAGGSSS